MSSPSAAVPQLTPKEQSSIWRRFLQIPLDGLARSWNPQPLRLLFLGLLVIICLVTALIGAVPTLIFGHDDFLALENGWRILAGQRPQLDFWSPWGPFSFQIMALGLKVSHASPNGIGYGNAIFGFLIGLWAYRLGRNRLVPVVRVLFALYVVLLVCSPYPLGESPRSSSHAMFYNRYGYALIALVLVECLQLPQGPKQEGEERFGGFSTGAAAGLMLFLKASFFFASVPLAVVSMVFWRRNAKRGPALILGLGAVVLANMAYLRFNFAAVAYALRAAAAARSVYFSPQVLPREIEANAGSLILVMIAAMAGAFLSWGTRARWEKFHLPLSAMVVCICDLALLSTNAQGPTMPIVAVFSLLVAGRMAAGRNRSLSVSDRQLAYHASLLLLCAMLFLPRFGSDLEGLAVGAARKAHLLRAESSVRFTEPRLSDLILYDSPGAVKASNGATYTTYVNEGTALLRRYCNSGDKVLTMDMQNPFPYSLGWQPPEGGIASTAFNYTISAKYRPSFAAYFGDATVVMIPRHPAESIRRLEGFYAIYVPAVLERFKLTARTEWWDLYTRK